jgi:hypothetical protein
VSRPALARRLAPRWRWKPGHVAHLCDGSEAIVTGICRPLRRVHRGGVYLCGFDGEPWSDGHPLVLLAADHDGWRKGTWAWIDGEEQVYNGWGKDGPVPAYWHPAMLGPLLAAAQRVRLPVWDGPVEPTSAWANGLARALARQWAA